jgi:type I restriction enzyme R subunit
VSIQKFEPIAITSENTVVSEYEATSRKSKAYESEAELEQAFVDLLQEQAYEYLSISNEDELVANLKVQIEKLNKITFSDSEWEKFFSESIAGEEIPRRSYPGT